MVTEIQSRYPKSKVYCYPDPSGNQRRTSANGQTDHNILINAGFIVKAPRKHDPVKDRINALNARLCDSKSIRHLFLSKKCKYTIECLEKYCFKEGTQIPDKTSGYDHGFDALSYCVAFLYPLRRQVESVAPTRWTIR